MVESGEKYLYLLPVVVRLSICRAFRGCPEFTLILRSLPFSRGDVERRKVPPTVLKILDAQHL